MNLLQMQLILEIAKTGSVSKAASSLFISQPNASNSVKALEREVGFSIFQRSSTGMSLTEKGKITVKNAELMLHYANNILKIQDQGGPSSHFHLGVVPYTPFRKAFERMVIDYQERDFLDFTCKSYERHLAMEHLCSFKLDLCTLLYDSGQEIQFRKELAAYPLKLRTVGEVRMHINFRQGHPLIGEGIPDLALLSNYPYVDYMSSSIAEFTSHQFGDSFELPFKYRIRVEQQDLRCSIVGKTNAFTTGFKLTDEILKRHNLVSFPLPLPAMKAGVITRTTEKDSAEIRYYIKTLKKILQEL